MRKSFFLSLIVLVVLAAFGSGLVSAQDKTPIEFGQWVEGTLTNSEYEIKYTFQGTKGQIILVEMMPKPGTYDLDPAVILRDSDGDVLGQSDDFNYPLSLVVAELTSDEEYTLLATRSSGSTGSTEGDYWVRVSAVEPLKAGDKIDATITSDSEKETPNVYVIRPESNATIKLGFSQQVSDLFAGLDLSMWENDTYPTTIFSMDNTAKVGSATFSIDLEAGNFYILTVNRSTSSYFSDTPESTVTVTLN